MGLGLEEGDRDLDERADRIMGLLTKLEHAIEGLGAMVWEREEERSDMVEDILKLQQQLRDIMAEVGLKERVLVLEASLRAERSKNWELEYQCRDLAEDVWRLEMQLRNSISTSDVEDPPWRPKTALERALESKVVDLEERIKNPKGRGRSRSM
jgi:SMC interacting uncharacterized protein involved in chromosome segregation